MKPINPAIPLRPQLTLYWVWIRMRMAALHFFLAAAPAAPPEWRGRLRADARRRINAYAEGLASLIFLTALARLGLDRRRPHARGKRLTFKTPPGRHVRRHCLAGSRIASHRNVVRRALSRSLRPGLSAKARAALLLAIARDPEAAIARTMRKLSRAPIRESLIVRFDPAPQTRREAARRAGSTMRLDTS